MNSGHGDASLEMTLMTDAVDKVAEMNGAHVTVGGF